MSMSLFEFSYAFFPPHSPLGKSTLPFMAKVWIANKQLLISTIYIIFKK